MIIFQDKYVLMYVLVLIAFLIQLNCAHFTSELYIKLKNNTEQNTKILILTKRSRSWYCSLLCNRNTMCRGFNYNSITNDCQLLEWPTDETIISEDFSVFFRKMTCADQPCENQGSCQDRTNDIYHFKCNCPRGWCGRRCEKLHYNVTVDACILGNDLSSPPVTTPEECVEVCLITTGCKASAFNHKYNTCTLEQKDHTEATLAPGCMGLTGYSYYYPIKVCDN
ncbi:uncharacterized protein LOC143231505 [Tachypleus tridentatus]|uniref:uncharacterized protein LOC143231505 n=1 Tax=Tachypleus tridentatus TaxID=6853 RepID=UPI003FD2FE34